MRAYFFRLVFLLVFIALVVGAVKLTAHIASALSKDKTGEETTAETEGGSETQEPPVIKLSDAEAENTDEPNADGSSEGVETAPEVSENKADKYEAPKKDYIYAEDDPPAYMGSGEYTSTYGIVVNVTDMKVKAVKNAHDRIYPASMTKILTLLVACEHIEDLDEMFEVTIEDTDYAFSNDLSTAGFQVGERVSMRDLLYGTILPSGGDAAHALARAVAGSEEAFAEMMNEKLASLKLPDPAHFTDCSGVFNENHYCSAYDMAVIINAAMDHPLAREVLIAHRYTTMATQEHPDGISLSNLFLRRIEDKDTGGEVLGAKTGYVVKSGNCAASYYTCGTDGKDYICVSADAHSAWRAIYDHVAAYNIYAAGNTSYHKQ